MPVAGNFGSWAANVTTFCRFRQDNVPQEQRIIGDDKYGDFSGGSSKNVMWTFGYLKKSGRGRDKPVHPERATSNSRGRVG